MFCKMTWTVLAGLLLTQFVLQMVNGQQNIYMSECLKICNMTQILNMQSTGEWSKHRIKYCFIQIRK